MYMKVICACPTQILFIILKFLTAQKGENTDIFAVASLPRTALTWAPEGKRNKGHLRETWRKTVKMRDAKLGSEHGQRQRAYP